MSTKTVVESIDELWNLALNQNLKDASDSEVIEKIEQELHLLKRYKAWAICYDKQEILKQIKIFETFDD